MGCVMPAMAVSPNATENWPMLTGKAMASPVGSAPAVLVPLWLQ